MKKFITEYLTIKTSLDGNDTQWELVKKRLYILWAYISQEKVEDEVEMWIKDKLVEDIKDLLEHVNSKIIYNWREGN